MEPISLGIEVFDLCDNDEGDLYCSLCEQEDYFLKFHVVVLDFHAIIGIGSLCSRRLCVRDQEVPGSAWRSISRRVLDTIQAGEGRKRLDNGQEGRGFRIDYCLDGVNRDIASQAPGVLIWNAYRVTNSGFRIRGANGQDVPLHLFGSAGHLVAPRSQKKLGITDEQMTTIAAALKAHKVPS